MKRHLIYVTPYFPPYGAGGAELTTCLHARILVRRGWDVTVVTPNYGAGSDEVVDGIQVKRFPFLKLDGIGGQVPEEAFLDPSFHALLSATVSKAIHSRTTLCIHNQNSHTLAGAVQAARVGGIPLVAHVRDTAGVCALGALCLMELGRALPPKRCGVLQHLYCGNARLVPAYPGAGNRLRRLVGTSLRMASRAYPEFVARRSLYQEAARIVFASQGLRNLYEGLLFFQDQSRHHVVYAPVIVDHQEDAELPALISEWKREGRCILLYVGKVSKGKGAALLLEASVRLARSRPEARLVIAGNLHGRWEFDQRNTFCAGFQARGVLSALYRAADIVLIPSVWPEPLGWASLDAGRFGRPAVASRVGGIPEAVIDGKTGLLFDKGDAEGMLAAIERLLDLPGLRAEMGRAAQEFVFMRFGEEAVYAQLSALYGTLDAIDPCGIERPPASLLAGTKE